MGHAYRSDYEHMIGARIASVRQAHETLAPWRPLLESVWAARVSRIVAGGVGIAGTIAMIVCAAFFDHDSTATHALVAASVASVGAYLVTRAALLATRRWTHLVPSWIPPRLTGQLALDVALTEAKHPAVVVDKKLDRLESWSIALPLVALSLLMPLTIHLLFMTMLDGSPRDFDVWIRISLVLVGHAHLTLAALAIAFGRKLRRTSDEELGVMNIHGEWAKAWGLTVLASCLPGLVFMLVPPILVAVTGMVFIPLMYIVMRRILTTERAVTSMARNDAVVRIATPEVLSEAHDVLIEAAARDHGQAGAASATV